MAIYEKEIRDGIQFGHALDYCWKCYRPGSEVKTGELEYKEVFKIHVNGLEYCLCMKHFAELLKDYNLIHNSAMGLVDNDNVITIPYDLAQNGTYEEVTDYIEKAIKK